MKKNIKRLVSVLITLSMMIGILPQSIIKANGTEAVSEVPMTVKDIVDANSGLDGSELSKKIDEIRASWTETDDSSGSEESSEIIDDAVSVYSSDIMSAYTVEEFVEGQAGETVTWRLDADGTLTISGAGDMYNFDAGSAPWYGYNITNVIIEDEVTSVGSYAFYNCSSIESVTLPDTVTSIGTNAMSGCKINWNGHTYQYISDRLSWFDAEQACEDIGGHLATVTSETEKLMVSAAVGNNSVWIGGKKGYDCSWEWITGEEWQFENWNNGEPNNAGGREVIIQSNSNGWNDTNIGDVSGYVCEWDEYPLETVDPSLSGSLSETIDWVLTDDMTLTITGSGAMPETFDYGNSLPIWNGVIERLIISEGITSIGRHTFFRDGALTSVSLPQTLENISELAFGQCNNLTEITLPDSVKSIGTEAFGSCERLETVKLPSSLTEIGNYVFCYCNLKNIEIPETVTRIGTTAFAGNYALSTVNIPDGVTEIGESAFSGCGGLEKLELPPQITEIGKYTFSYCTSLKEIDIPDGVTEIGEGAFYNCMSLESVVFPDELDKIGNTVFIYCEKLKEAYLPDGLTSLGDGVFRYCYELERVRIPGTVTSIGDLMFDSDDMLTDVELEEGITMLGSRMFWGCGALELIEIPSTVTEIGSNAFNGCSGDLLLMVTAGSYAEEWASENGIAYDYTIPGLYYRLDVVTEESVPVTSGYDVFWYEKGSGEPVAQGTVFSGADEEKEYEYFVVLGEELGIVYRQPERTAVAETNICTLEKIPYITVSGTLADEEGEPKAGAEVIFTQTVNGKYTVSETVSTDESGYFTLSVLNAPTEVLFRAAGCYDQRITILKSAAANDVLDMGTTLIRKAESGIITIDITRRSSAAEGEEAQTDKLYSTSGLVFEAYNKTRETQIGSVSAQYPKLTIGSEGIEPGDEVIISAADETGRYTCEPVTVTLDSNENSHASLELVENGKIKIGEIEAAGDVRVMLFGDSRYIDSYTASSSFETNPLPDGNYTLILMQKTDIFSAVSDISRLDAMGMENGTDYIRVDAETRSGRIETIPKLSVPEFDEGRLCFTVKDSTKLTAANLKASAGKYISMRAEYEIDERYESENESVSVILPENIVPAAGSVTVNNNASAYTYEDGVLTVHTNSNPAVVRFYVITSVSGDANISAELSFENEGHEIVQPLGNVFIDVTESDITVPSTAGAGKVVISGVTLPKSNVAVYDNNVLAAETVSNAVGKWKTAVDIGETTSYKYHGIQAEISSDRLDEPIMTEEKGMICSSDHVGISKITMINTAHSSYSLTPIEYKTVFDFVDPSSSTPSYSYWPSYPTFTFTAEFIGDSSEWLEDVYVVTMNAAGDKTYVPLEYDAAKNQWIGKHDFSTQNIPTNVSIAYNTEQQDPSWLFELMAESEGVKDVSYEIMSDNEIDFSYMLNGEVSDGKLNILEFGSRQEMEEYLAGIDAEIIGEEEGVIIFIGSGGEYGYCCVDSDGNYVLLIYTVSSVTSGTPGVGPGGDDGDGDQSGDEEPGGDPDQEPDEDEDTGDGGDPGGDDGGGGWEETVTERPNVSPGPTSQPPRPTPSPAPSPEPDETPDPDETPKPSEAPKNCGCLDGYKGTNTFRDLFNGMIYRLENCPCIYGENEIWRDQYLRRLKLLDGLVNLSMLLPMIEPVLSAPLSYQDIVDQSVLEVVTTLAEKITEKRNNMELPDPTLSLYDAVCKTLQSAELWFKGGGVSLMNDGAVALQSSDAVCECELPEPSPSPQPGQDTEPIMDPSGYVCEAVPSNRVEGVTVTAYTVENVLNDFGEPTGETETAVWDAEDYSQINPLITDANGEYAWDVPAGSWQVKFEKEGYETAYSEWMPVPPPQTEVHADLVSNAAPEVKSVSVYSTGIRIEFSQYMDMSSVNTSNVSVLSDGVPVSGIIEPLNSEPSFEDPQTEYASIFMFAPENELAGDVSVSIKDVVNYASKGLENEYNCDSAVEIEPESIEVQAAAAVEYNGTAVINLRLLPVEAGADKIIRAVSSSSSIAAVSESEIKTDANGNASVTVSGGLPGSGEISFSVDGTDITAKTTVTVLDVLSEYIESCKPVTASKTSGAEVEAGEEIILSTETEGAEIYYTLDKSDPTDPENPSRSRYTAPIIINGDMYITAYAAKEGCENSATSSFVYTLKREEPKPEVSVSENGGTIAVSVNFSEIPGGCSLYAAVYDQSGRLLSLEKFDMPESGSLDIDMDRPQNTDHIKVMLWDTEMTPVEPVHELSLAVSEN